jgi:hypothetical protein
MIPTPRLVCSDCQSRTPGRSREKMGKHLEIIIDYDSTLTAEETQVAALAEKSLETLAKEIVGVPRERLAADYQAMWTRLLRALTRDRVF